VQQMDPDVLLLDLKMPGMDGLSTLKQLHAARAKTRVIVLTCSEDKNQFVQAMKFGTCGIVLKQTATELLIKSIRKVHAGEIWLDSHATAAVIRQFSSPMDNRDRDRSPLSQREREIVALVVQGFKNKEMAEKMFISEQTAKNHLHNIFDKLGVSDRLELALYAIHKGLDRVNDPGQVMATENKHDSSSGVNVPETIANYNSEGQAAGREPSAPHSERTGRPPRIRGISPTLNESGPFVPEWIKQRRDFLHDELGNYQNTVKLAITEASRLDVDCEVNHLMRSDLLQLGTSWASVKHGAQVLLRDFEDSMSPRTLLSYYPLCRCDDATKKWLGDLIHEQWVLRCPVRSWRITLERRVHAVDRSGEELTSLVIHVGRPARVGEILAMLNHFATAIRVLRNGVESLPWRIRLI
jgi:two-component system nitrate/nitrite response regulator NarL